jgi:hypothetical protein
VLDILTSLTPTPATHGNIVPIVPKHIDRVEGGRLVVPASLKQLETGLAAIRQTRAAFYSQRVAGFESLNFDL